MNGAEIGGQLVWANQFYLSAMRAQSHNALGQAGLLIGREHLVRLDAPDVSKRVAMDDVARAVVEMPLIARSLAEAAGHRVEEVFLSAPKGEEKPHLVGISHAER